MLAALLLAQAVSQAAADISLHATLEARSVKVESRGTSSVRAWADPDGGSEARSSGRRASRRFELHIDARIADLISLQPPASTRNRGTESALTPQ